MQKSGGVVIPMQLNSSNISYLVGKEEILTKMPDSKCVSPFRQDRIDFLNLVSRFLLADREAKEFPDVVTFAFWCRKASMEKQKERFEENFLSDYRLGRGMVFHIAPSNVAVNYAYSFVVGFITGNANVVRLPSRKFPQIDIINRAIKKALEEMTEMKQYICFLRYGREKEINDNLSMAADVRVIWGGNNTIQEIRKSNLKPRAGEIAFADRYSVCVINADQYLTLDNKIRKAEEFYNDTYLTDQNACTSPKILFWIGKEKKKAKEIFWPLIYEKVKKQYEYQSIQGVNKLTSFCRLAIEQEGVKWIPMPDNLLTRIEIKTLRKELLEYHDNSGYFLEYDMENIEELLPICDERIQTVSYIGNPDMFYPLLNQGIKGIDRIVPVGSTMDFDFIWDGYDLVERLTRKITVMRK